MKTETENLNASDSLKIISDMIQQAKGNVQKDSFYFLFWGWVTVAINIGIYYLVKFTTVSNPYLMWLLTIPAWIITFIYAYRAKKNVSVRGHLDYVSLWIWIAFSITIVIFIFFGSKINYQLNGLILLATALPTIVSGAIIRFKPLMIGGAFFWVFGSLCFFVSYETQCLLTAAAIFIGYLIPGYLLKKTHVNV